MDGNSISWGTAGRTVNGDDVAYLFVFKSRLLRIVVVVYACDVAVPAKDCRIFRTSDRLMTPTLSALRVAAHARRENSAHGVGWGGVGRDWVVVRGVPMRQSISAHDGS